MSSDPIVYRSADPAVVQAWKDAEAAINAYVKQTQAVLDDAGLGRYRVYRNNGWSPGKFAGLAIPQDEFPPDGWRQNKAREYATPDKRLKAGKQIAAALEAVKHPGDPLHKLIGMPADTLSGGGFSSPGVRLLEDRTALYVLWRLDPDGRESFSSKSTVDHGLWKRVRLSEYYAACEQADEAKKTAQAAEGATP